MGPPVQQQPLGRTSTCHYTLAAQVVNRSGIYVVENGVLLTAPKEAQAADIKLSTLGRFVEALGKQVHLKVS